MDEVWKEIQGYDGKYYVSSKGRVKVIYRYIKAEKLLSPMLNKDGYYQVNLSINKKVKHHRIHRLVAEAFVSNPNNFTTINHKDENKQNNSADNLEWCTHSYNIRYGTRTKRSIEKRKTDNSYHRILSFEIAEEIRKTCVPYDNVLGIKGTAKKYGVSTATVSAIVNGRAWKRIKED